MRPYDFSSHMPGMSFRVYVLLMLDVTSFYLILPETDGTYSHGHAYLPTRKLENTQDRNRVHISFSRKIPGPWPIITVCAPAATKKRRTLEPCILGGSYRVFHWFSSRLETHVPRSTGTVMHLRVLHPCMRHAGSNHCLRVHVGLPGAVIRQGVLLLSSHIQLHLCSYVRGSTLFQNVELIRLQARTWSLISDKWYFSATKTLPDLFWTLHRMRLQLLVSVC